MTKSKASAAFLRQKGFDNTVPIGVGLDTDNFSKARNADKQIAKIDEIWDQNKWNIIYVDSSALAVAYGDVCNHVLHRL